MEGQGAAVKAETRAKWQARVDAWRASGKSCREFAQASGLNPQSLAWWKWKLGSLETTAEPEFVEVTEDFMAAALPGLADEPTIELLVSGVEVRVRGAVDPDALTRVLDVLEARR